MAKRHAPTTQQQQAIDAQGVSVVLSSGAGCGKTSVLTARYLKHLDDGDEVGQVVAITFTERAAREMRDRIRGAIVERLRNASEDSAARWNRHLRGLEAAPISTIHSFCGNILRQHALAAGLDPSFEILEEVLARNLRSDALRLCLQDLLVQQSPAGDDLRDLIIQYGWPSAVEAIRQFLSDPDPAAWTAWLGRSPQEIETDWLGNLRTRLQREWGDYLAAADPNIAYLLNLLRVTPCKGPEMSANVERLLDETPRLGHAADPLAAAAALRECAKVGKERGKAWDDDASYQRIKSAFEDFRDVIIPRFTSFGNEPKDLTPAIGNGQRFLRVALEAVGAYQARKARGGFLDFQDLLVRTRDLLRDNADVRQVLQQRFRHILLDEMQDTDPVQMELILALCTPVEIESGKLFAVGDSKQSIYRFRGAEVRLFRELRALVPAGGRLELTGNFRSQRPILDFVNALCSRRIPDYEPLEAQRLGSSSASVEFLWSVPVETDGERETARSGRVRDANAVAARIRRLIDHGERRIVEADSLQLRPVQMQDIVLLFRSMSNVSIYEEALRRHGIDYYLIGGRAFFAQQEVFDLLNLLRALENPDDSLSLAGALRSPFACLSDEALFVLASGHRGRIWEGMHDDALLKRLSRDDREALLRARRNFVRWRELKDRLPIARLIGELFAASGYDAAMQFEILADRKLANLWKLQELGRTFDRSGQFGLTDFIQRLGELVRDPPREEQAATLPENANVVKLMTIHQAKGLEFPVVFVPDLGMAGRGGHYPPARWHRDFGCLVRVPPDEEEEPPFSDLGWKLGTIADAIADWQEDLRILYVACTRAEDLLILSTGFSEPLPPSPGPGLPIPIRNANSWMMALTERFNLRTGECLAVGVPAERRPRVDVRIVEGVEPVASPSDDEDLEARPNRAVLGHEPEPDLPSGAAPPLVDLPESATVSSPAGRLFRAVFRNWDLTPGGWQPLLEAISAEMDFDDRKAMAAAVTEWFRTLDASTLTEQFLAASERFAHLEFLSAHGIGGGSSESASRGELDLLWRDRAGAWHLALVSNNQSGGADEQRSKSLLLDQSRLVREQLRGASLIAGVYDLSSGSFVEIEPSP